MHDKGVYTKSFKYSRSLSVYFNEDYHIINMYLYMYEDMRIHMYIYIHIYLVVEMF